MSNKFLKMFVCFFLFMSVPFGFSQDISFGVKAEAGIDAKTRKWINSLPEKVRLEVMKLLQDALPLIDESIQSYLTRVDEIMASTVIDVGCQTQAAGKSTMEYLEKVIPFAGLPTPIDRLLEEQEDYKTKFNRADTPTRYAHGYANLVGNISLTRCQLAHAPEVIPRIDLIMKDSRSRFNLWVRLESEGTCNSARECYEKKLKELAKSLTEYDSRDISISGADKIFASIEKPVNSRFRSFRQDKYEAALFKIYLGEDSLALAKEVRIDRAQNTLNLASNGFADADRTYQTGLASLRNTPNIATTQAKDTKSRLVSISALVHTAEEIAPELSVQVNALRHRIKNLEANAEKLIHNSAIRSRELAAEAAVNRERDRRVDAPRGGGGHIGGTR